MVGKPRTCLGKYNSNNQHMNKRTSIYLMPEQVLYFQLQTNGEKQ